MASRGDGVRDAVPERRADGLLRRPRGGRRLRACGATTWPRCTRSCSAACSRPSASAPARADRRHRHPPHARPPTTPTSTSRSRPGYRSGAGQRDPARACSSDGMVDQSVSWKRTWCSSAASRTSRRSATAAIDEQAERYGFKDSGPRLQPFAELERVRCRLHAGEGGARSRGVPAKRQVKLVGGRSTALKDRGTVSMWCMGVNQHVRGTWMNNLITDLHLITGKISRPGANPVQPHRPALAPAVRRARWAPWPIGCLPTWWS